MTKPPPPAEPVGELTLWASGDEPDEASVSLQFIGDEDSLEPSFDPSRITRLLGVEPTRAERPGDSIPDPLYHRVARRSCWRLHGERQSSPDLEQQVLALLGCLPPPGAVWDELEPLHGQLFCGLFLQFWNRECCLTPVVLHAAAERHLMLRLDIYYEPGAPVLEDPGQDDDNSP